MAQQFADDVRNARANQFEGIIGAAPVLELRTGAQPANCAAADSGSLVASFTLPSDWLSAASSGAVSKVGTWSVVASGSGIVAHFRIKASSVCKWQGSAGESAADMILDNNDINAGQTVTVSTFSSTEAGA